MNIFAKLLKVEDQEDGTIRVYGIASSESRDSDNEITRAEAIRKAIPGYLRHGSGALREMHQPSAAGKVEEIDVGKDNITRICAHVVDPVAILKVKTQTYKGFSIGGRVTDRSMTDPREITGCDLIEISLVDRPANPEAVINLWKADMNDIVLKSSNNVDGEAFMADAPNMTGPVEAELVFTFANAKKAFPTGSIHVEDGEPIRSADFDAAIRAIFDKFAKRKFSDKEREAAASSGEAMRDGSYPIKDKEDLHNAIRAVGRGKNNSHAAIRAHIKRRAKALGAEDELPADWGKLAKGMDSVAHMANILSSVDSLLRNSEWEQAMEHDSSDQPAKIHSWLKEGSKLLISIVDEEAREIARVGEDIDDEFALVAKAADWARGLRAMVKARAPKVGENLRFGEHEGAIEELTGDKATVRTTKGHLQEFIFTKEARYDEEEKCWVEKRGSRHNREDMAHLQSAHDHLAKLGAMCGDGEATKLGKAVMALSPDSRKVVELLTKVSISAPIVEKTAEEIAAEAARAADLAKAAGAGATLLQPVSPVDFAAIIGREMSLANDKFGKAIEGAIAKMNETASAQVAPVAEAVKLLTEKVDVLAAQPVDAKGVVRVVQKVEDAGGADATEKERLRKAAAAGAPVDHLAQFKAAFFGDGDGKHEVMHDFLRPQAAE